MTPTHEESGRPYALNVQVEVKSGGQIPASFAKAFGTDWFRRAISQAERAIPIGVDAKPAVALKFPDSTQTWLVVKG